MHDICFGLGEEERPTSKIVDSLFKDLKWHFLQPRPDTDDPSYRLYNRRGRDSTESSDESLNSSSGSSSSFSETTKIPPPPPYPPSRLSHTAPEFFPSSIFRHFDNDEENDLATTFMRRKLEIEILRNQKSEGGGEMAHNNKFRMMMMTTNTTRNKLKRIPPSTVFIGGPRGGGGGGGGARIIRGPPLLRPQRYCVYCKDSGEDEAMVQSHCLRNPLTNKIICPRFRQYKCEICGATGDFAHLESHCSINLINQQSSRKIELSV